MDCAPLMWGVEEGYKEEITEPLGGVSLWFGD